TVKHRNRQELSREGYFLFESHKGLKALCRSAARSQRPSPVRACISACEGGRELVLHLASLDGILTDRERRDFSICVGLLGMQSTAYREPAPAQTHEDPMRVGETPHPCLP